MQRRIVILVADGYTDSGSAIALDVFRTAIAVARQAGKSAPFDVAIASARGGRVRAASGSWMESTRDIRVVARRADVLVVPGIWMENPAEVDATLARDDVKILVRAIARAHARGALVCSSCGGAFLLAEAGVLDGRECTTTWWLAPHLARRRPAAAVHAERALVVTERVVTAGALFAQADLALHLVSQFAGPKVSRLCARLLLLDAHPSQASYMAIHHLTANDPSVRRAEAWVRAHLDEDFDVSALAKGVGVSTRTLSRRLTAAVGVSTLAFVQRIRVETAVHLLETTRLSLQEIAERVGYSDTHALRRLVQRETRSSPRELRRRAAS